MSLIPTQSIREIRSRVASPVIVKTKQRKMRDVFNNIKTFELERFADKDGLFNGRIIESLREKTSSLYERVKLDLFDMFSVFLPREIIFELADQPSVERIFYDDMMYAFNNINESDIYEAPRSGTKFITTKTVKKLVGSMRADDKGFRGNSQLLSVVDTGGSRTHEQNRRLIFDSVMHGQPVDQNGHGEHCISTAGGISTVDDKMSRKIGKTIRCEGMATDCKLVGIKSLGFVIGAGSTSSIAKGINRSIKKYDADVISMSLGGKSNAEKPDDSPYYSMFNKINEMKRKPIVVVAAGNSGPDNNTVGTPGCLPNVVTVGAYNPINGKMADFSSRGPTNWGDKKPDCVAPGVNIYSGIVGMLDGAGDETKNRYSPLSGTSMATPVVSGLITQMRDAYWKHMNKHLTISEIKTMLRELGNSKNNTSGWGIIDWDMFEHWMETEHDVVI